jgi:hypothetical protein
MADKLDYMLNGINPSSTGTFYSEAFPTNKLRDLSVLLLIPTTAGSGSDTLDISIEESDQRDFTDAERIRTVLLTAPGGTTASQFTQVVGGTSSPNSTLQQKFNLKDNTYNRFVRVKYVIAGTATNFTDITLIMTSNERV